MRFTHSRITRALVTLVTSGCIGGIGTGLMGIAGGNGANGTHAPPVLAFFVQPNSVNVGQVISPPVEAVARDSLGGTDSTFTGSITTRLASKSPVCSLGRTTLI